MKTSEQSIFSLLTLFLFCSFLGCSSGQTEYPGGKQSGVDSLLFLYRDTIYSDPQKARRFFDETKAGITDSIDYYKLTLYVGICYFQMYRMDSALLLSKQAQEFCRRQPPSTPRLSALEAHIYNYRGIFFQETGRRDSAVIYLQKAYQALYRANERDKLPDVCINLADNYAQSANFSQATSYYRRALTIADSLNMGGKVDHAIYLGLARIYAELDNFSMAEHFYLLAEKNYKNMTPYEQYLFANTRGNYYYIIKEYPNALKWFYTANAMARTLAQPACQAITESNLGEVYLLMNQTDSAQYYLDKAGAFFLAGDANSSARFYFNGLYASLALQKNDLPAAERLLSAPYDADEINPTYIYFQNKRMEELYRKKNDFKRAYACVQEVKRYDDSLRNIKTRNNIAEIDSRYRQDTTLLKRDILIAKEKSRSLQLRNISVVSVSLLLFVILSVFIAMIYVKKKREHKYARQVAMITKLRMENIRNRISPHYVFNVLNAVMPALHQHEQLIYPLKLLILSIRKSLLVSEKIAISLDQEVTFVKDYLRLRGSINSFLPEVRWSIAPEVDMQALLPSMIMQIPVENAIKYAFDPNDNDNLLLISIYSNQSDLHITIWDNGLGLDPGKHAGSPDGTGTGFKVLYRTVELLNVRNHRKIMIKMQITNALIPHRKGTSIQLTIPLNYNFSL